jgi:hypothetical protein
LRHLLNRYGIYLKSKRGVGADPAFSASRAF